MATSLILLTGQVIAKKFVKGDDEKARQTKRNIDKFGNILWNAIEWKKAKLGKKSRFF